jgi:hypothetical protein
MQKWLRFKEKLVEAFSSSELQDFGSKEFSACMRCQ